MHVQDTEIMQWRTLVVHYMVPTTNLSIQLHTNLLDLHYQPWVTQPCAARRLDRASKEEASLPIKNIVEYKGSYTICIVPLVDCILQVKLKLMVMVKVFPAATTFIVL